MKAGFSVVAFSLLAVCNAAQSSGPYELILGVSRQGAEQVFPPSEARKALGFKSSPDGIILGYVQEQSRDEYYVIHTDPLIRRWRVNGADKTLLGSYPLKRWGGEFIEQEVINSSAKWSFEHGLDYQFEPSLLMGCIARNPIRYGDIDMDGKNELVIVPSDDVSVNWVIFSTELNKVVFSGKLEFNDVIDDVSAVDPEMFERPERWQYWSVRGLYGQTAHTMRAAQKAFAKLYFGDFDEDGKHDIVMWRKFYESRKIGESPLGFELKKRQLLHYEKVNGEYRLQETPREVMQSWLANGQLTWSKGYPNRSECPGQENLLIPELHDPLLNDPEVLN